MSSADNQFQKSPVLKAERFDLLAVWRRNPAMAKAAYYNLLAAALTAPVAIASGLIARQWQLEGERLKGNLKLALAPHLRFSGVRNDPASLRVACSPAESSATNAGHHLYSSCTCHGLVDRTRRTPGRDCQRRRERRELKISGIKARRIGKDRCKAI